MTGYGDAPPQYSAYPPQGYENRRPPNGPPPPGGPRPGADDRGLTGTLVGLGAAAVAGQAVQQHMNNPQQQQPGPGMAGAGMPGGGAGAEDPLAVLRRFDTVILVDDSASMQEENRWSQAEQSLRGVADTVVRYDSDGVDVYFLNASEYVRNARSSQQISQAFSRVRPVGASTPTEVRVEELLGIMDRLEQCKAQGQPLLKPLNLIIITDGAADDPDTLAYSITGFCERLDAGRFPLTQLGIQLVQVGSDRQATRALQELDDELKTKSGVKRDIVDTTPYQGHITSDFLLKVVLGGINKRIDRG